MSTGRIHPDEIAFLRTRVPIEDIIGQYVALKRAGTNFSGLCPFHDEGTPSFSVSPDRGLFHCFGCQESGDMYTFLQKIEDITFVEAVEKIAEKAGHTLKYVEGSAPSSGASSSLKKQLIEAHKRAMDLYTKALWSNPKASEGLTYLRERGFTDDDIATFNIGYSPDEWSFLTDALKKEGFSEDILVQAGLATKSKNNKVFDRFRNRLMWPIFSASGEPIGFGARRLTEDKTEAKWLNTSETPIYKKSEVLYGLHSARKAISQDRKVVIVEGYGDVMACHLSGIPYAVAASGTAFGTDHIRIIKRLLRDDDYRGKIIFTFDGDEAGMTAARRAFPIINQTSAQTLVALAPDGMDPLDLKIKKGSSALVELVENAVPLIEFVLQHAINQFDLSQPEARISSLRAASDILLDIKDVTLRDFYIRKVAGWVGLPESSVASTLSAAAKNRKNATSFIAPAEKPAEGNQSLKIQLPNKADPKLWNERELLKLLVQAETVPYIDLPPNAFTHPAYQSVFDIWYQLELNTAEPYNQMKDKISGEYLGLLNELVVEPRLVSGEVNENLTSLTNRVFADHLEIRASELKAQLASASVEEAPTILTQITQVEKTIKDLLRAAR